MKYLKLLLILLLPLTKWLKERQKREAITPAEKLARLLC